MSVERVALTECVECGDLWLQADEERWRTYLDTEDEIVFCCPDCAEREFGDS
jgi:hypothetical protein